MTTSLRVTLLGTGSPTPSPDRQQSAALVEWGETSSMLVDAGDGVVGRMLAAGAQPASVEDLAFTHLHWDHVLGYPAFVWGSWCLGRSHLRVVGPAGTREMHQRLVEDYYRPQAEWAIGIGFERSGWDGVHVTDIDAGWTTERDGCRIEAGAMVHPPMAALGFRFTHHGRCLAISGDTVRCDELIELARGADLLVVDACAAPPPAGATASSRAIAEQLHEFHASPQDCVDVAREAGVGRVVLTHHRPGASFELDVAGYDGKVITPNDLDVIVV